MYCFERDCIHCYEASWSKTTTSSLWETLAKYICKKNDCREEEGGGKVLNDEEDLNISCSLASSHLAFSKALILSQGSTLQ